MLKRTHFGVGLALGFYFLPFITHKFSFVPIVLLSSLLPDIDSASSALGQRKIFRPIQGVFEHRGPLHSFTVCIFIATILSFFYPIAALPFFLGYSFHLFLDSFTIRGIRPFWPLKMNSSGMAKSGGMIDRAIFLVCVVINIILIILLFR